MVGGSLQGRWVQSLGLGARPLHDDSAGLLAKVLTLGPHGSVHVSTPRRDSLSSRLVEPLEGVASMLQRACTRRSWLPELWWVFHFRHVLVVFEVHAKCVVSFCSSNAL